MISEKFIRKYLRLAHTVAEDDNPCYSRHVGAVIVNRKTNRIKATGYNGPPTSVPHNDDYKYLHDIVWPQMTSEEAEIAYEEAKSNHFINADSYLQEWDARAFATAFANKKMCIRRCLKIKFGERLGLCACEHAEKNAIYNSCEDLHGCWMFCWCGVPCWDCSKAIINAGITRVICVKLDGKDYSCGSRWMLNEGGVYVEVRDPVTFELIDECTEVIGNKLYDMTVDLFGGDEIDARLWLQTPNREFNGETPLSFAITEKGKRELENVIGRLNHGIFG